MVCTSATPVSGWGEVGWDRSLKGAASLELVISSMHPALAASGGDSQPVSWLSTGETHQPGSCRTVRSIRGKACPTWFHHGKRKHSLLIFTRKHAPDASGCRMDSKKARPDGAQRRSSLQFRRQ